MKKSIVIILLIGIVLFMSCKDVEVFYPIPLTAKAKFLIQASGGSFSETLFITTDTLFKDLQNELNKAGLSWNDIDRIRLEGAAYTIYDPSVPNTVVDGKCDIAYETPVFVKIMTINNVNFTEIEGKPQVDPLTIDGVALLNQVWDDFLIQLKSNPGIPPLLLIGVRAEGSLTTQGNVTFTIVVEFTTTAVVKQKQRTFNIFG